MSMKQCPKCKRLFEEGDHVRAQVLSIWHVLKSQPIFAMEQPYACEYVEHLHCEER